jgi:hypothetical protein
MAKQCEEMVSIVRCALEKTPVLLRQFVGVVPVGSLVYCPDNCNDLDLVILLQDCTSPDGFLCLLSTELGKLYSPSDVVFVSQARVPILKFVIRSSNSHFDMAALPIKTPVEAHKCVYQPNDAAIVPTAMCDPYLSICYARWVTEYLAATAVARVVFQFVKTWAQARCVYGTTRGFPGGAAWMVLVSAALRHCVVGGSLETILQVVVRYLFCFQWHLWDTNGRARTTPQGGGGGKLSSPGMVVNFPTEMQRYIDPQLVDTVDIASFNMCSAVHETQVHAIQRELSILGLRIRIFTQQSRCYNRLCDSCSGICHISGLMALCQEELCKELCGIPHTLFLLVFLLSPASYTEETFVSAKLVPRLLRTLEEYNCLPRPIATNCSLRWCTESMEFISLPLAIMICTTDKAVGIDTLHHVVANCTPLIQPMWRKRAHYVRFRLTRNIQSMLTVC